MGFTRPRGRSRVAPSGRPGGLKADDRDGIRNRGTSSGNRFDGNHMSGNAEHDAHDENRAANTWAGNHCATDFPPGTICVR